MSIIELVERTGFHDAELTVMQMLGDRVYLQFEDVGIEIGSDDLYRANLNLGGVHKVTRDGVAVSTLYVEGEGSSVIQFERSGSTATLVLDWISYTRRTSKTRSYSFAFNTFDLRVEKQEQAPP